MKKWLFFVLILILGVTACSPKVDSALPNQSAPQEGTESQPDSSLGANGQAGAPEAAEFQEQSSGPLTARIFSAQEATINQQRFTLEGWVNRAAVISANDIIAATDAEDEFSIDIQLEDGPNLVEVIISDQDGNEVRFELIIYVEG